MTWANFQHNMAVVGVSMVHQFDCQHLQLKQGEDFEHSNVEKVFLKEMKGEIICMVLFCLKETIMINQGKC